MNKLITARLGDKYIIGEYDLNKKLVNDCYQLITISSENSFQYAIRPLLIPFSFTKPVNIDDTKLSEWVEIDPSIFDALIMEYFRIKTEIKNAMTKQEVPKHLIN
jgi:hypothetical protein